MLYFGVKDLKVNNWMVTMHSYIMVEALSQHNSVVSYNITQILHYINFSLHKHLIVLTPYYINTSLHRHLITYKHSDTEWDTLF